MKDRVSKHPGRMKMTRADGSAEYVTLTRADEPQIEGDPLCKANLLPDGVASALKLTQSNPQVKDALLSGITPPKIASFETAGSFTWTVPNLNNGQPYRIGVLIIGAGGAGGAASYSHPRRAFGDGGASGYSVTRILTVTPGTAKKLVVGAKGSSVSAKGNCKTGGNGGSSSFDGITAKGGGGGIGTWGSTSSTFDDFLAHGAIPTLNYKEGIFGPDSLWVGTISGSFYGEWVKLFQTVNVFENMKPILGSGGGAGLYDSSTSDSLGTGYFTGGKNQDGLGGGNGAASVTGNATAQAASLPGCGGGGASVNNPSYTATSGAGGPGAVYIYFLGVAG